MVQLLLNVKAVVAHDLLSPATDLDVSRHLVDHHLGVALVGLEPDTDYKLADRVGAKYNVDLRTRDRPGEGRVIVTIRPARVRAWG